MEITLGSIVSYVVGIPLVLVSFLLTLQSPFGLIPLFAGLLVLPPVRRQLAKRAGVGFSRWAAGGIGAFGVVSFIVVLILVALSGGGGGVTGADVSNVSVSAQDASPSNPSTSLNVVWNARAQSAVDPDPGDMSIYNSNEGEKFLVVRVEVTNSGDEPIELDPRLFKFQSEGVVYDYQPLFGSGNSLSGVSRLY